MIRKQADQLAVGDQRRGRGLTGHDQIDVEPAGVLLRLDLRRQLRLRRALDANILDLVRIGLAVVLDDRLRRGQVAADIDDRERDRLGGGGQACPASASKDRRDRDKPRHSESAELHAVLPCGADGRSRLVGSSPGSAELAQRYRPARCGARHASPARLALRRGRDPMQQETWRQGKRCRSACTGRDDGAQRCVGIGEADRQRSVKASRSWR